MSQKLKLTKLQFIDIGLVFLILSISIYAFIIINRSILAQDANYYLMVAKEILRGGTPMFNIQCSYPPLAIYIYALFIKIFGTSVLALKLFVLIIQYINSFLMGIILWAFYKKIRLLILICCLYCLFTLTIIEGIYVLLEPFQVLFVFLALFIFIKNKTWRFKSLVVGLFLGLSFFCKQYSLTFIVSFYLMMLLDVIRRQNQFPDFLKQSFLLTIGICTPLFMFILLTKAELIPVLNSLNILGKNVVNYTNPSWLTLSVRLNKIYLTLRDCLLIVLPLFVYPFFRVKKNGYRKFDIIYILGILTVPILYVRTWPHYLQLIAPWSFCLWYFIINETKLNYQHIKNNLLSKNVRTIIKVSLFCIFALFACISTLKIFNKFNIYHSKNPRATQINECRIVNTIFSKNSMVYIAGGGYFYYECDFYNPLKNYSFYHYKNMLKTPNSFPFDSLDNIIIGWIGNMNTRKKIRSLLKCKGYTQIHEQLYSQNFPFDFFVKKGKTE